MRHNKYEIVSLKPWIRSTLITIRLCYFCTDGSDVMVNKQTNDRINEQKQTHTQMKYCGFEAVEF